MASDRSVEETTTVKIGDVWQLQRKGLMMFRNENERDEEDEVDRAWGLLKTYSLSLWPPLVKELTSTPRVNGTSMYSLFTFKQLQNIQLGISKLVKKSTVRYLCMRKACNWRASERNNLF